MTPFQLAQKEVARWGIPIRTIPWAPSRYIQGAFNAPSTGGYILWRQGDNTPEILWEENEVHTCALIHELCHCLVWLTTGNDPVAQYELDFVALERTLSRRCRADWKDWMHDYTLPAKITVEGEHVWIEGDWDQTSTKIRHQILKLSTAKMTRLGLMKNGKPSYETHKTIPHSDSIHSAGSL